MNHTLPLLGYLEDWWLFKREMLALVRTMRCLFLGLLVFMWAVLPWRTGWRGVGLCVCMSTWFAYGLLVPWAAGKLREGL